MTSNSQDSDPAREASTTTAFAGSAVTGAGVPGDGGVPRPQARPRLASSPSAARAS